MNDNIAKFLAVLLVLAVGIFFIRSGVNDMEQKLFDKLESKRDTIEVPCLLREAEPIIVPYEYGSLDIHNERWRESFIYKASSNHKAYEVTIPRRDLSEDSRLITVKIILEDDIESLEQDY